MAKSYKNDEELFALLEKELFTAVVGDILDMLGYQKQFLPQYISPIREDMKLAGRAMPGLEADVYSINNGSIHNPLMSKPFGLMLEALDDLKAGEIYVASGASHNYALWGELMSTRAKILEAKGALVNGYVRDIDGILTLNFPCYCAGFYAQDQGPRGKVIDYRTAIEFGGIRIEPGDLIFGDKEGVLIVPQKIEVEAIEKSLEKARGEKLVARAIQEGMSACEAFDTFGIM